MSEKSYPVPFSQSEKPCRKTSLKLSRKSMRNSESTTKIYPVSQTPKNINYRISSIPELAYLDQFYIDYQCEYLTELQKRPDLHSTPKLTDVSTTVDFPFLGEDVIEGGQAKYMFVFQGSLARPELLAAPCSLAFGHSTSVDSPVTSSSSFGLGGGTRMITFIDVCAQIHLLPVIPTLQTPFVWESQMAHKIVNRTGDYCNVRLNSLTQSLLY